METAQNEPENICISYGNSPKKIPNKIRYQKKKILLTRKKGGKKEQKPENQNPRTKF